MLTAAFYTFGCRLNQTETAMMAKGLENDGYQIVQDVDSADLCVINTCTVTNQSDAKCLQKIRSIKRENPEAVVAVVGCYSQISPDKIVEMEGIDLIIGNEEKLQLANFVREFLAEGKPIIRTGPISKGPFKIQSIGQHLQTTRANLKIQDGCDFICSFCIIPKARGRARSREIDNIREEARMLSAMGVKEVILTGVNIGTFQADDIGFIELLDLFESIEGIQRIRISSIEPTTIGVEIFPLMSATDKKVVPHLHLPLQSANDTILNTMRRKYQFSDFGDFVKAAVAKVPRICIGSDVIVGFPGETDEMFEETVHRLQNTPIHYFHVFPYAEREGTSSARMNGSIDQTTINKRAGVLRKLSEQKRSDFYRSFIGQDFEVLFEGNNKGSIWNGYSENYIRFSVHCDESLANQIRKVRLVSVKDGLATGSLV
jgi:threonylcarbamoyladenosine tRNA methylthiotransferase MtaB